MRGVVHMPWIRHGPESEAGRVLRLDRDPLHAGHRRRTYVRGTALVNSRVFECTAGEG